MDKPDNTIILLKDNEWSAIDGEVCRVINFSPWANINNGKIKTTGLLPYCVVTLECQKLPSHATGYITHKIDFTNLWKAFKERGVKENEEVVITWTKDNYKRGILKTFSAIYPRLIVWICNKNAYEAMNDRNSRPDLDGIEYFNFIKPLEQYKPEVMV